MKKLSPRIVLACFVFLWLSFLNGGETNILQSTKLKKQKVSYLKELIKRKEKLLGQGLTFAIKLLDQKNQALMAEFELCPTQKERKKILEEVKINCLKKRNLFEEEYKKGAATISELNQAQLGLIIAEAKLKQLLSPDTTDIENLRMHKAKLDYYRQLIAVLKIMYEKNIYSAIDFKKVGIKQLQAQLAAAKTESERQCIRGAIAANSKIMERRQVREYKQGNITFDEFIQYPWAMTSSDPEKAKSIKVKIFEKLLAGDKIKHKAGLVAKSTILRLSNHLL